MSIKMNSTVVLMNSARHEDLVVVVVLLLLPLLPSCGSCFRRQRLSNHSTANRCSRHRESSSPKCGLGSRRLLTKLATGTIP